MRKLIALGSRGPAAPGTGCGGDAGRSRYAEGYAFPGKRIMEVQGSASTFGAPLQEPEITTAADSVTVAGAGATFRTPRQEPQPRHS